MGTPTVQVYDPDLTVTAQPGVHWDIVLQFGQQYESHTTWYLSRAAFDQLIDNLLKAQLSMSIADADERNYPKPGEPPFSEDGK